MKVMIFHLRNVLPDVLFGEEGMENLRHLMSIGCYGFLDRQEASLPEWMLLARQDAGGEQYLTLWEYLSEAGKRCLMVGDSPRPFGEKIQKSADVQDVIRDFANEGEYSVLKHLLSSQEWDYLQFEDTSSRFDLMSSEAYLNFDREFGEALGSLSDDAAILVVADLVGGEKPGCFVLAAPNNPLAGEHVGGLFVDIAPTLLELAGYPLPEKLLGKSWVAGMSLESDSGLSEEEEAILRERLSGLGYI